MKIINLDVPATWRQAVNRIYQENLRAILVLGATDVGKSAFCKFLSASLIERGAEVGVVDADIGQKDIGPPAAVTLGYPIASANFEDTVPADLYFIGNTSPVGHLLPLVLGTARLARETGGKFVAVNTTGFIHGPGRALKQCKIEAIEPDVIVAIDRVGELEPVLRPNRFRRIFRLAPSPMARIKDPEERRAARRGAFGRYFLSAKRLKLDWGDVAFQRTLLFTGDPVVLHGAVYAEETAEGLVVIGEDLSAIPPHAKVVAAGFEKYLLCGVADEKNRCVGLTIIERIDFDQRTISLFTPVDRERIHVVQLGDLYVGHDGEELGHAPSFGF